MSSNGRSPSWATPTTQLAARLEGELVVCGLHDARRAARVAPVLARLGSRRSSGRTAKRSRSRRAMAMLLAGRPPDQIAAPLEAGAGARRPRAENWDTRAALLWVLVAAERFDTVEESLEPMLAEVHRSGSARGFVAAYSTLGLLKLRLGALPEADAAARVALRVLQEGDFAPGLGFAATVLADVAVEAGELDEAQALLDLLPQQGWPAGVGTVLIPAARGRLRLAQGRAAEALADFEACSALFGADVWGMRIRETVTCTPAPAPRSHCCGSASASARASWPRPSWPMCGCSARRARSGSRCGPPGWPAAAQQGLALLERIGGRARRSPALLERAHSLAELGAALRRSGERAAAREPSGPGARAGRPLRRPAAGRPGPRRAEGDRRPPAPRVAHRRGSADPQRAARRPAGRRGPLQPRDRL